MAKQLDKNAIFEWLRSGAAAVQNGINKGVQKTQAFSEKLNQRIDSNPRLKNMRDHVSEFAHAQSEKIQNLRINGTRIGDLPNAAQKLTERQLGIIHSMMRGLTNREIAVQFSITPNGVKAHIKRVCNKIGAANRTEAVAIAMRKHLLKL